MPTVKLNPKTTSEETIFNAVAIILASEFSVISNILDN
jgi:hypothetical protein